MYRSQCFAHPHPILAGLYNHHHGFTIYLCFKTTMRFRSQTFSTIRPTALPGLPISAHLTFMSTVFHKLSSAPMTLDGMEYRVSLYIQIYMYVWFLPIYYILFKINIYFCVYVNETVE
ncbi:hypothetical protein BDQ17DRAFT_217255 [Cyathus striatus]|nr:hypothetical protein BDQ17DRAFT_217255 [Cyathus striatus]